MELKKYWELLYQKNTGYMFLIHNEKITGRSWQHVFLIIKKRQLKIQYSKARANEQNSKMSTL